MTICRTMPVILQIKAAVTSDELDLLVLRINFLVKRAKKIPIMPRKKPITGRRIDRIPTNKATTAFSFVDASMFKCFNNVRFCSFLYQLEKT